MNRHQITGVILAGGKNSRMGTDKGLLMVNGQRIVEKMIEVMKSLVDEIIIISNSTYYDYLGYKIYPDLVKDCGPMGGIYTALSNSANPKIFVVSCDMPFVSGELIRFIIENSNDCEIVIPQHGEMLEPLCAVYDKLCKQRFGDLLQSKELKLHNALRHFKVKQISIPANAFAENCFENINTPAEYDALKLKKDEYSS